MDLICDLPETSDGYKHILVTVCYLSKYIVARALKSKTTSDVIGQLEDIYLGMGLPISFNTTNISFNTTKGKNLLPRY